MKLLTKLLFFITIHITIFSNAQNNKLIDSLKLDCDAYKLEDTIKIKKLTKLASSLASVNPQSGMETAEKAIALANKINQPIYLGDAYKTMGFIFYNLGKFEEAIVWYNKAIDIYIKHNVAFKLGSCYKNVASMYGLLLRRDKSLEYFDKAAKIFKDNNYLDEYVSCTNMVANVYMMIPENQKALDIFDSNIEYFKKRNMKADLITIYQNKSIIYMRLGHYAKALECLNTANKYIDQNNENEVNELNTILACIYELIGETDKALLIHNKILASAIKLNSLNLIARTKVNIANVYKQKKENAKALQYYDEVLQLDKDLKDPNINITCLINKSNLLIENNKFNAGFKILQQIEESIKVNQLASLFSNSIASLYGDICLKASDAELKSIGIPVSNRYQLAEKYFKSTLIELDDKNFRHLSNTWLSLSKVYEKKNDYKEALSAYSKYVEYNDSLLGNESRNQIIRSDLKYEFDLKAEKQQIEYDASIKRKELIQKGLIIGLILLCIICVLFYRAYKLKNRTNILINQQKENLEILNATKDKLFGIIGHDLRKPAISFSGITKKVNFLIKENDMETLNKFGNVIEKNANELNSLIDNLLGWSLLQKDGIKLNPKKINLYSAISEVLNPFQSMALEKNITIHNEVAMDENIEVDEQSLNIILRNLIHNALKFTEKDGHLFLSSSNEKSGVVLSIRDTGIGMTDSEIKDIFKFQSASTKGTENEKGTGLGMYIVGQWAKLNNINLNAKSEKGVGTTFDLGFTV